MAGVGDLWLTPAPHAHARSLMGGRIQLTPNPRASRALGVPPMSLHRMAQNLLAREQELALDPLTAAQLTLAVAQQLGYPDPQGAARRFAPVISEVLRAGLDLEALAAFEDPRVQEVVRFILVYTKILHERQYYDPAQSLWLAAQRVKDRQPILVTGFPRLGRDEEQFVLALAAPGSAVVLPFEEADAYSENLELAKRFELAGWTVHLPESIEAERPSVIRGWQFADQEAEVRGVLAHVKELLLEGTSPAEVNIVARDDAAYGPLVLAIAQEQGVPVHAEYQIPLSRTRFGHWLDLLTEVVEAELPFESTFRLLSHPLCRALKGAARTTARKTHPSGSESWAALGMPAAELSWPDQAPMSDWVDRVRTLLNTLGIVRRARLWASEAIAVGRFMRAIEHLQARSSAPLSREAFLAEVRGALSILTTPAHPARGGVGLHTPLALFGSRAKHLFVLGAAEDHLPARLSDDTVLDFATRKRLFDAGFSIETAAAAARRERLTFNSLLSASVESLTVAYPRMMAGKTRLPSPGFGWLGLLPESPEVPVASIEEGRRIKIFQRAEDADPVLARARVALEIERRREAPGTISVPDTHDGYSGVPVDWRGRTFSATQLSNLGQCAFKWYAQKVLRVQEPEEASDDLLPNARGKLYHKTLDLACRQAKAGADFRQAVLERLESAILEAEDALVEELGYHLSDLPFWEVRRQEHLTVLQRAIRHDGFIDSGAVVEATERDFTNTWREFCIQGQVDRIDRVDGSLVIIDYKAGSSIYGKAQDSARKATIDLQLPIYAETAAPVLFPDVPVREAFYYTLSKPKRHRSDVDPAELEGLITRLKDYLDSGHFPVAPDLKRSACDYCDQVLVCRAGARLGRKEA